MRSEPIIILFIHLWLSQLISVSLEKAWYSSNSWNQVAFGKALEVTRVEGSSDVKYNIFSNCDVQIVERQQRLLKWMFMVTIKNSSSYFVYKPATIRKFFQKKGPMNLIFYYIPRKHCGYWWLTHSTVTIIALIPEHHMQLLVNVFRCTISEFATDNEAKTKIICCFPVGTAK